MKHKVLQLIGSFEQGGSEAQAVQLSMMLASSGRYEVHAACLSGQGVLRGRLEQALDAPIPEYPLTSFHDRNFLIQLGRFVRHLRQLGPAVIHTHDFYTNIFGMAAATLAGVPVRIASRRESAVRSRPQRLVERLAYRAAHKVVANCEEVRRQLIAEGVDPDKMVTIYNGVDLGRFSSRGERSGELLFLAPSRAGKQVVTLVANLRLEMKDHPTFLRAARMVAERVPESIFAIAGEGPLLEPMRKLAAELGIADQVRFIGHCGSIPALLAASDVCVLSSKSEGFSNSILEYMAAGRPVIATNVGGASEAVLHGVNGYIVNAGDHVKMAERITSLLLSPEQSRKMGEIGRGFVTERFSSEVQLATVEAIYDRLIETSRTASREERQGAGRSDRSARLHGASEPGDIRVLIVAPSLDILGGQAIQADRLLSRLKKADGVQASLQPINPRLPGPLASLQRIKYVRTLVTSVLYVASLLLRSWRADVLHVFSASYLSFILAPAPAILIGRLFGKKVILNYRSGEAEDHLRRWPRSSAPVMRLAHRIAVPSGYLVDVFRHFGMRAVSIHNFVDLKQFAFRARPVLRPVFLSNRNLEPNYNVACILRAFSIIQSRFPEARLTIAGDGSLRRSLETLASELGLKNVEFAGRIGNDRMHELYDRSDIYLNGSDVDNMPGSLIEAFASGTPVVTTNAGGIPYIVSDRQTGLVVPVGDYRALASSAVGLLEDQALAQSIIKNAYAECRKYSWEITGPEWMSLYSEVFGELKGSSGKSRSAPPRCAPPRSAPRPLKDESSMSETFPPPSGRSA